MEIQHILDVLAWIGGITGVILLIMFLLQHLAGTDIDVDFGDIDVDGHSLGIVKSLLTFLTISSLTIRAMAMSSEWSWTVAISVGIVAGLVSVLILYALFKLLLSQEEDGSWRLSDAVGKVGTVYIPIPARGSGKINVVIGKTQREIVAESKDQQEIATNQEVLVVDHDKKHLLVVPYVTNTNQNL